MITNSLFQVEVPHTLWKLNGTKNRRSHSIFLQHPNCSYYASFGNKLWRLSKTRKNCFVKSKWISWFLCVAGLSQVGQARQLLKEFPFPIFVELIICPLASKHVVVPVYQMVIQERVLAAPRINVRRFVEIITSPIFPEQESKEWVLQHQSFVIQVFLSFSVKNIF